MEKSPMYAVLTPPGEGRRQWLAWMAAFVSLLALVVSVVTACVAVQQLDRVTEVEQKMIEMKMHFERLLNEYDYDIYDYDDPKAVNIEELTLQSVVRKKREADDGQNAGVPIYEQAYGLPPRSTAKGLRLYGDFLAGGVSEAPELGPEVTESPIKPYHRNHGNELDGSEEADAEVIRQAARSQVLRRRSRVKATERASARANSVVPQTAKVMSQPQVVPQPVPQPVPQMPQSPKAFESRPLSTLRAQQDRAGKKIPRKKQSHRRRRTNPVVTVAHFVATPANRTAHHHAGVSEDVHGEWSPAAWMDKLGLNRKYSLRRGVVTVKEAGLYYLYAQVLYQPGRFGSGFQVVVDSIPIMECTLAPAQPSPSCHTGGATYLPRNAAVYIRDLDHHMTAVKNEENSFFGLVKLMDAPATAEKLLLG
ncbi:ectodysplasin-A-like isoform X8 [Penaeus chinensis]|uniref:ectodysplasin-A-like isoform X8 n=1 Tax=Penaeus chinensis TaxID=139456 RepID=UPI001FB5E4CC|nr:ectodysplasin-A-like isoform X8 [Penaeus chinensis]